MVNVQLAQVKDIIRPKVLSMPEVTSVSYDEVNQDVIITVRTEADVSKVQAKLPSSVGGYDIIYRVLGPVGLQADAVRLQSVRPIPGGVSIGNVQVTAGTLATRVYDRSGNLLLLSNSHVFTPVLTTGRFGKKGDLIVQPGAYDKEGGPAPVAELLDWVEPMGGQLYVDGAIARPLANVPFADYVLGEIDMVEREWVVTEALKVEEGMRVKAAGRTSGVRRGKVTRLNVDVKANDSNGKLLWQMLDQAECDMISEGGDSGGIVVLEDDESKAVGLFWGGSSSASLFTPIGYVMQAFDIGFSYPVQDPPEVPLALPEEEGELNWKAVVPVGVGAALAGIFGAVLLRRRG
ncbi:MAG: hypothetical protein PHZ19_00435 [Candidatus Thermoplasmatota archaeon]|nr:hypothetical protein [Candidatus Thermoplasmatota archaeon]